MPVSTILDLVSVRGSASEGNQRYGAGILLLRGLSARVPDHDSEAPAAVESRMLFIPS